MAAAHSVVYYERSRERDHLAARLADVRLQLLSMQLQPHFLFNTLNTIAELVHGDPDAADYMIAGLSDLLRKTLELGPTQEIPLDAELDLLGRYLSIQKARFGERLRVTIAVDDDARIASVPVLLFQPLVENAIRHGLAERVSSGRIDIAARRDGARLVITVTDDGPGAATHDGSARERVGLGNTRARRAARGAVRLTAPARSSERARARRTRVARDPVQGRAGAVMTVRVLIVDDEAVARRRIRRLLAAEPDVTVVGECADGASALRAITSDKPDIAFLDVQMPELDGFEVVQSVSSTELPAVVFVTAFDRYALRAFDVHAIDYLLKPFTRERFRTAVSRARERLDRRGSDDNIAALLEHCRATRRYPTRVAVRAVDRFVVIDWRDVDWVEAADNYVKLHVGTKEFLLRDTLGSIEKQLDPEQFARIHRSAIVQLDRIAELHPSSHGDVDVVLRGSTRLVVSRTWREHVQRLFHLRSAEL